MLQSDVCLTSEFRGQASKDINEHGIATISTDATRCHEIRPAEIAANSVGKKRTSIATVCLICEIIKKSPFLFQVIFLVHQLSKI